MTLFNTDGNIKLSTLIKSGQINDSSIIQIFDNFGNFLTRGAWYSDSVLEYTERFGKATKPGTGRTVNFRLAY